MALYMIGDIQGCHSDFLALLERMDFSPSRDTLYVLGDLVNRGPDNVGVLQTLMGFGSSAVCLLGNHDLHLLAVHADGAGIKKLDTIQDVLQHRNSAAMLQWLSKQHLAWHDHGWLMVHAGVLPSWSIDKTLQLAREVENHISDSHSGAAFFKAMYGNQPNHWRDEWQGIDRIRAIVNALTRLRFCDSQGHMDFDLKEDASSAPPHLMPWFDVPNRATAHDRVAFGHWSTLRLASSRHDVLPLDTGCVWGGTLSAARIDPHTSEVERLECPCQGALRPV